MPSLIKRHLGRRRERAAGRMTRVMSMGVKPKTERKERRRTRKKNLQLMTHKNRSLTPCRLPPHQAAASGVGEIVGLAEIDEKRKGRGMLLPSASPAEWD